MKAFFNRKNLLAVALLAVILASACSPKTASPTPDAGAVYTQAAMTVQVAITQTAAAKPSATPIPTHVPTNTAAPTLFASATSNAPVPTVAPATATKSPDVGVWMAQNPGDGVTLQPGQAFTLTWQVKNSGTTTWTTQYMVRYYLSDLTLRMGAADSVLAHEVKPNETIDIQLPMTAPTTPGSYTTFWVLTNKDGVNFSQLTFSFNVGQPAPTAPPDVVPTATQEALPTVISEASPTP